MNLDEFRALKAEEEKAPAEEVLSPATEEVKPEETPVPEEPKEIEVEIDGVGKVNLDELRQGYMRQSDYTRKTQEIAEQKKLIEEQVINLKNSSVGQQAPVQDYIAQQQSTGQPTPVPQELANNPFVKKITELEQRMYDMALRTEIQDMRVKYDDFDVVSVLTIARDKGITNLEDAYRLHKASIPATPVNTDEVREQIRREILEELSKDKQATKTLISQTDKKVAPTPDVELTEQQRRIASEFGMGVKEYASWSDK